METLVAELARRGKLLVGEPFFEGGVPVTVDRKGSLSTQTFPVRLDASGDGLQSVPFSEPEVAEVTLTLGNASTRFDCNEGTYLSCEGIPRDDNRAYAVTVTAVRP